MKKENVYLDEEPRDDVSTPGIRAGAPYTAPDSGKPSFLTREECLYV